MEGADPVTVGAVIVALSASGGVFTTVIVTAGARDIPPTWVEQLADGGRLVVPLRTKGLGRSWALEHSDGYLVGREPMTCAFVPMQGLGEHRAKRGGIFDGWRQPLLSTRRPA